MQALISAVVIELPLAFVLIAGPLRLLRYVAIRHGVDPAGHPDVAGADPDAGALAGRQGPALLSLVNAITS